jgi:hypothetical protein
MKRIGLKVDSLPFELNKFEGILLFQEYPTTIIYQDIFGNPIIKEWVDVSDDYLTNQYYYYKTSRILLKQFVDGNLPHAELINLAIDSVVYYEDRTENRKSEYRFSPVTWIPPEHKPNVDFYFKFEDGVDSLAIIYHFSLDEIDLNKVAVNQAKEISKNKKSETLYIHLNKGKGIGFGTANTEVLAKTLLKFDSLYKEAALDHKLSANRGAVDLGAKKNSEYLPFTTTEVYGNIAASFSLLLRPIVTQVPVFGNTDSEDISTAIFSLISKSDTVDNLRVEYPLHSEFTIKAYKEFIDEIYKQELDVNINWFSPLSTHELSSAIDYKKANLIHDNIENLTIESDDKFTVKGKFRSVNCDTGYCSFVSTGGEKFSGYFDKLVREGTETINFIDIYEITISRVLKKEAGKQEGKITDTIMSFPKA